MYSGYRGGPAYYIHHYFEDKSGKKKKHVIIAAVSYTHLPYGTLCGAMTQDIDERAKINTSRSVAAMIARCV